MVHLIQHSIKHTLRTKHVIKEIHTHCRKVQKDKKGIRNRENICLDFNYNTFYQVGIFPFHDSRILVVNLDDYLNVILIQALDNILNENY